VAATVKPPREIKISLRRLRYLWFVYAHGDLDFIGTTRQSAEEMAEHPTTSEKRGFMIERWKLAGGKYVFDRRVR